MIRDATPVVRNESQRAYTKFTAREDLALEFTLAEENALPHVHLSAGPNERLPGISAELTHQKNFNLSAQMLCPHRAGGGLRRPASTPAEQPGGNHARIV